MMYVLNEDNEPVFEPDIVKWGKWFQGTKVLNGDIVPNRRVAFTRLVDDIRVSTIFLGIDHGFGAPPVLWETMIFRELENDGTNWSPFEEGEYQERYTSHADAIAGHTRAVDYVLSRRSAAP